MENTFNILDISMDSFGHDRFDASMSTSNQSSHKFEHGYGKLETGQFVFKISHEYVFIAEGRKVVWINTSTYFELKEYEFNRMKMETISAMIALVLEYTKALFAYECKEAFDDLFLLMNQPEADMIARSLLAQIIRMN